MRYYLELFENNLTKNKSIKWNWCAALFGGVWFIYRRMYGYGYIDFAIGYLIAKMLGPPSDFKVCAITLLIYYIGTFFFLGFFGNSLYLEHVKNKIGKENPPEFGVDPRFVWALWIIPLLTKL